jgi:hypothetical protein
MDKLPTLLLTDDADDGAVVKALTAGAAKKASAMAVENFIIGDILLWMILFQTNDRADWTDCERDED